MKWFLSLLLLTCAHAGDEPNVLFLMADDLTAEALACYGNGDCATPGLDRLSERGLRFTQAYCQYPVCGPSRAAVMSGRYPKALGIMGNGAASRFTAQMGEWPSLAQHFREEGWQTVRVGKIYHMRVPGDITAGVDGPDHAPSWDLSFNAPGPE